MEYGKAAVATSAVGILLSLKISSSFASMCAVSRLGEWGSAIMLADPSFSSRNSSDVMDAVEVEARAESEGEKWPPQGSCAYHGGCGAFMSS